MLRAERRVATLLQIAGAIDRRERHLLMLRHARCYAADAVAVEAYAAMQATP